MALEMAAAAGLPSRYPETTRAFSRSTSLEMGRGLSKPTNYSCAALPAKDAVATTVSLEVTDNNT